MLGFSDAGQPQTENQPQARPAGVRKPAEKETAGMMQGRAATAYGDLGALPSETGCRAVRAEQHAPSPKPIVLSGDWAREYLALVADTSITGPHVARELSQLRATRRKPETIAL